MNDISNLFTDIGDFFLKADWYPMVKWPFWILLSTVAAGGVYCARFGKKTLLNQGACSMLNILIIYLSASMFYIYFPSLQSGSIELPFLSANEGVVALVDPFTLNIGTLSPILLRFMILTISVSLAESLSSGGKSIPSWFFFQLITVLGSLVFYTIVIAGLTWIAPAVMNRYAVIPVGCILILGVLFFIWKMIFTVLFSGGNPTFGTVYRFFTVNKFGSLLTTSALCFLLSMAVLCAMNLTGSSVLVHPNVNVNALWIVLLMLLIVLYIFGMFYNDKKKA